MSCLNGNFHMIPFADQISSFIVLRPVQLSLGMLAYLLFFYYNGSRSAVDFGRLVKIKISDLSLNFKL